MDGPAPTSAIQQRVPRRMIRCKMCRQELAGREQVTHSNFLSTIAQMEAIPPGGQSEDAKLNEPLEQTPSAPMNLTPGRIDLSKAPILANPACSGYFVEPLKWMDHFLQGGELVGKIICPTPRCKAKLGNYDWSGVGCGCKEWITPGFCINRSKVDEITIV